MTERAYAAKTFAQAVPAVPDAQRPSPAAPPRAAAHHFGGLRVEAERLRAPSAQPMQLAKKRKKQRTPSFKERTAQSLSDKIKATAIPQGQRPLAADSAWGTSLEAVGPLPDGWNAVKQSKDLRGPDALTSFNHQSQQIKVDFDPRVVSRTNWNRKVGQLTSTFTHELGAHGVNIGAQDPDHEHGAMHAPATRNAYLATNKRALAGLANNTQKRAFINSWHADMNAQISVDDTPTDPEGQHPIGKGEKRARRDWVRRQRDAMKRSLE